MKARAFLKYFFNVCRKVGPENWDVYRERGEGGGGAKPGNRIPKCLGGLRAQGLLE